jgi:Rod binding domain-containing protein
MLIAAQSGATGPAVRSEQGTVADPRLKQAAREFEAQMMKELLAPMNHRSALFEDGDSEETGVMGEFASESLAGALSARGGLGIANQVVQALSRSGHSPGTTPVTGKLHIHNEMSPHKSLQ